MRKETDKVLIVGGDRRFDTAEDVLKREGYTVFRVTDRKSISEKMSAADILILPLPYTADRITVFHPEGKEAIPLSDVFRSFRPGMLILTGKADSAIRKEAEAHGAVVADYNDEEDFSVKNAVPTAEGAISLALDLLPVTLNGSDVLVLGFGRIGKLLALYLHGFGARVTVAARKPEDRSFADACGYHAVPFSELTEAMKDKEAIFNTVPSVVLTKNVLDAVREDTVLIDLASSPGGIDRQAAAEAGLKAVSALGLPGKTAPVSAGRYLAETVIRLLSEREEGK